MRIRWIALAFALGALTSYRADSPAGFLATCAVCMLVYALRGIQGGLMQIKDAIDQHYRPSGTLTAPSTLTLARQAELAKYFDTDAQRHKQGIGAACVTCNAVVTAERLHTCADKACPQPDFAGRT